MTEAYPFKKGDRVTVTTDCYFMMGGYFMMGEEFVVERCNERFVHLEGIQAGWFHSRFMLIGDNTIDDTTRRCHLSPEDGCYGLPGGCENCDKIETATSATSTMTTADKAVGHVALSSKKPTSAENNKPKPFPKAAYQNFMRG